jgi:uncharacterized protein with beta-barrel porin domain
MGVVMLRWGSVSRLALIVSVAGLSAPANVLAQTFTVPNGVVDTTAKTLNGTQTGTVEAGGTLRTTGGQSINWNNASTGVVIANSGIIENTAAGRAIDTSGAGTNPRNISLINNQGAIIRTAQNDAFRINLAITSGLILIDNAGLIQAGGTGFAALGQALDFRGMSAASGATTMIINRATGVMEALTDDAVRTGRNAAISNFGIIRSFGANTSGGANGTSDAIDAGGNIGAVITNQAGGLISGARHGITADTDITVINQAGGTILGRNGSGVGSDGAGTVTNYGTITGAYAGVGNIFNSNGVASTNGDGDGVDIDNAGSIVNFGRIEGLAAGGFDSGGRSNTAEGASIGGGSVQNSGTIIGERGIVVNKDTNVDRSGVAATTILNNAGGSIVGLTGYAIRLENKTGTTIDNDTVVNRGTIIGNGTIPDPNAIVLMQNGTADPNSAGTLNGVTYTGTGSARFIRGDGSAIQMGEGNDTLSNYGTIVGNSGRAINMEGGNDTLNLYTGSSITGVIDGGVGLDTINLYRETGTGMLQNVVNVEALNVLGGTWTLADAQAYVSGVLVGNGATLVNNGTLTANLQIQDGGAFGGSGAVIGNTTFNGGLLSPGNSIGTITFNGNLTLTAATTYLLEVSATDADRVNVTGTATLGGATVSAVYGGAFVSNTRRVILNATGGVVGTFGSLVNTNLPSSIVASLSYDANNAYLNLALNFAAASGPAGLNANQASVAAGLTNAFNAGGIPLAFAALNAQGLTRASGEAATGAQQASFDAMDRFLNVVTDPFLGERAAGMPGAGASAFADEDTALGYAARARRGRIDEAYAAIIAKAPPRVQSLNRWSVWATGYGGTNRTDGNVTAGSSGFTDRVYGGAAGVDYRVSQNTLIGVAMGGAGTNYGLANGLGDGRSDVFQAGVYGRHVHGAAYIAGALAYGWHDVTTDRTTVDLSRLRGRFDANALSGRLEGGYRFATPLGGLTPYAAGQFTTFFLPDYAEQVTAGVNTFALGFASKDVTASRSELGLRADQSFVLQDAVLTLRGRAAWAHNFDRSRDVAATFQTLPVASFVVNGAAPAADAALVTAGGEMKWRNGFAIAATFEGEFSRVTESYAGKGTVRYSW